MTLAELWELFPIYLTAPDPNWDKQYCEEEKTSDFMFTLCFQDPDQSYRQYRDQ
jgi:hypothetical protein